MDRPPHPALPHELQISDQRTDRHRHLLTRFTELMAQQPATSATAELLPSRLAVAASLILGVAGAGVSLLFDDTRRLPIGASDVHAAVAERLQFTAGDGPCWVAQQDRRPIVAGPHEMTDRWPAFAADLLARTPYRAVVSLPLIGQLDGVGTVDLYLGSTAELRALHIADTVAVADEIARQLTEHLTERATGDAPGADHNADHGVAWLGSPGVRARARVWQAMGRLDGELGISDEHSLQLLRTRARETGRTVDDIAEDVCAGVLPSSSFETADTADTAPGGPTTE